MKGDSPVINLQGWQGVHDPCDGWPVNSNPFWKRSILHLSPGCWLFIYCILFIKCIIKIQKRHVIVFQSKCLSLWSHQSGLLLTHTPTRAGDLDTVPPDHSSKRARSKSWENLQGHRTFPVAGLQFRSLSLQRMSTVVKSIFMENTSSKLYPNLESKIITELSHVAVEHPWPFAFRPSTLTGSSLWPRKTRLTTNIL